MEDRLLRLRQFVGQYLLVIGCALVVLAAVGGWATYDVHADKETTTERRPGPTWERTAAIDYAGVVTSNTSLHDAGTQLENQSHYITRVAPRLAGEFEYGLTADDGGELDVRVTPTLVLRANSSQTTFWETRERLPARNDTIRNGEQVRVPFAVNVTALRAESQRIREEIDFTRGATEAVLMFDVTATGTVNGREVERSERYRLPVTIRENSYRVDYSGPATETVETQRTVTVVSGAGPLERYGGPLALVVGVLGLAGIAVGRHRGWLQLDGHERERLEYSADREDLSDWISTATVPDSVLGAPEVEVSSLRELVDIAIDTDQRVIEDVETGRYVVRHDDLTYAYDPPTDTEVQPDPVEDGVREDNPGADRETTTDDPDREFIPIPTVTSAAADPADRGSRTDGTGPTASERSARERRPSGTVGGNGEGSPGDAPPDRYGRPDGETVPRAEGGRDAWRIAGGTGPDDDSAGPDTGEETSGDGDGSGDRELDPGSSDAGGGGND